MHPRPRRRVPHGTGEAKSRTGGTVRKRLAVLAAGGIFLAAVSAAVAGVDVEYNRTVDFTGFKTYAWKKGTEAPNSLTEKRIHRAVDEELKAKGLTQVEESPDLYVITHAAGTSSARLDVNGFGYAGYGWTGYQYFAPAMVDVREKFRGTLFVDLLEAKANDLIWRGVADENLGMDPNPEKVGKTVFKIVKQMFKDFPPKPEKK
jgi:hypothetical protein